MAVKVWWYYALTLFLVAIDQLSKYLIFGYIKRNHELVINPYLSLTHVHNPGAAFSFLGDGLVWQKTLLLVISTAVSIAIVVWMSKIDHHKTLKLSALSILLAGAVGNLLDRYRSGSVLDFIDLHYQGFFWPIFNIADVLITLGVVLLLIESRGKHE